MLTEVTTEPKTMISSNLAENAVQQEKADDSQNERSSYDKNDRKKKYQNDGKEYQQSSSPRRNINNSNNNNNNNNGNRYNRISSYHNGNRQNRNSLQQQFTNNSKQRFDTNNNSNNKIPQQQQQPQNNYNSLNNYNAKGDYQEISNNPAVKKPIQKNRVVKPSSANPNYDDYANKPIRVDPQILNGEKGIADDSGINLNTSVSTLNANHNTESRQKYPDHSMAGGDNASVNRKYSMDFLHQVGHQYKLASSVASNHSATPKTPTQNQNQQKGLDDANLIALKVALGDNSGYYNHLYSGSMYTNQLLFQQQQHQQYQQTYARFQHQQIQQQRMRMYPRQDSNYQRMFQQDVIMNRHQQQQNSIDNRSYHNSYYHQTHHNSFQYQQNRAKQNRDQNRNKSRQNNSNSNGNNNNSTNERNNFNNKKYNNDQNARISHSKSDSFAHYEEPKRKNLMYIRTNSDEFRSLSPTPPSSVKSSSPGIQEKMCVDLKETLTSEFNDDSASTASTHSAMSYSSDNNNKELSITPTILLTPTDVKESNVDSWINNNFTPINNVLSASAEQLRHIETPITIIKRPPSASGISSSTQTHSIPRTYSFPTYDPTYPFDYYFARGERCEIREEPINLCCGSVYDSVSQEIWDRFQMFQQTHDTYRSKMVLWRDLYELIRGFPLFHQRACPKWGLFLVGSTISGFGLDSSDVDMCLVLKTAPQLDPRTEAMITLSTLKNYLITSGSTFQGFYLINAKVPILRFRDSTNTIEVDLNYNNCIGVRNTHLLYCYAQLDWRLRPLAIIVKLWAQYHNINDARNSTISSYSLVLMVIHFLQSAVSPPVLPCLHQKYPEKFQVLHDITTIDMMEHLDTDWKSENYQPLGELFLRFLDYYSNFDYTHNAISIRTGGVLSIEECRSVKTPKNDPNHWQTLCIEEPFDLTNTARSTYDGEIFEKTKNVFFQSWRLLREYKTLDSLFQEQLFVQQVTQHPIHNVLSNQTMSDIKYIIYAPNPSMNSSPIITANQMNAEITS